MGNTTPDYSDMINDLRRFVESEEVVRTKQITFPSPKLVTKYAPDGSCLGVYRYGQYEAILVVKENGYEVGGTVKLSSQTIPVTHLELEDGHILQIERPWYCTNKGYYA